MWITVKEAAIFLNIKEKTIYHLVNQGLIPHYRIGKMVRFNKDELENWMRSKKAGSMTVQVEKIVRSAYTSSYGRPDHLKKEVG
jgi:excisionase family DNA binding protein